MKLLILVLSIIVLIRTISYGLYEVKENNNKPAGIIVIAISIISTIAPNVMMFIRGNI
jgi:hypothetical protein